jgi:hypothetical protein
MHSDHSCKQGDEVDEVMSRQPLEGTSLAASPSARAILSSSADRLSCFAAHQARLSGCLLLRSMCYELGVDTQKILLGTRRTEVPLKIIAISPLTPSLRCAAYDTYRELITLAT